MLGKLLAAFIIVPIIELTLLIGLGSYFGFWPTVLTVLGTGVAGAFLARTQGLKTMVAMQQSMAQGHMPAEHLVDGFLILVAGVVLLTPGILTDMAGLLLLIPWCRGHVKVWLRRLFDAQMQKGRVHFVNFTPGSPGSHNSQGFHSFGGHRSPFGHRGPSAYDGAEDVDDSDDEDSPDPSTGRSGISGPKDSD